MSAIWCKSCTMIFLDSEKNNKLIEEREISFEKIFEIILREEYVDILENPSRKGQLIFIIHLKYYIYTVPFVAKGTHIFGDLLMLQKG
jgi:hypothetical protein